MENIKIPDWLVKEQDYKPANDKDTFIKKSILTIVGILSKMKFQNGRDSRLSACPALKMFYTLLYIILIACSKNMAFTIFFITCLLVRLCMMQGVLIKGILKTSLTAVVFSALILIPSIFLGSPQTFTTIITKVFATVTLMSLLSRTTRWNTITESLKIFFIPDLFVFTLDITLKYIVMLGEICLDMLYALRMRSVGKNLKKGKSLAGVLGVTFIKSKEMSEEMYGAMCCRGFNGEYHRPKKLNWRSIDWIYLLMVVAVVFVFIYLEGAMK